MSDSRWQSDDAGRRWAPVASPVVNSTITALYFDPRRPDRVLGTGEVRPLPVIIGLDATGTTPRYSYIVAPEVVRFVHQPSAASMDAQGAIYLIQRAEFSHTVVKVTVGAAAAESGSRRK